RAGCQTCTPDTSRRLRLRCARTADRAVPVEAVGQGGVAAPGAGGADRDGEGLAAADKHDEAFGAGDRGVEQVALQQRVRAHGQRDDHGRVFAALRAVHGDRVRVLEFVELVEVVVDVL